ncbi:unnamed protein product [Rhizoctonia solani]|uniref:Uncharacterized protein n=1 Tax=Rhizoctonia solani TaxID=456999 RepID=A0A8H3APW4_9AGAM|nr:unnamed protein product [Rhizoctonia solani]
MSESLKGLGRDEVAARRAALTDGRWRNREGVGMYQRSTSNALRNILSGVKSALPSLSRARAKSRSRSRSISPKKRATLVSDNPETVAESPGAGPSRLVPDPSPARPAPSPARSTRSRRSSARPATRKSSVAAGSTSLLSPRAIPSPTRKSYVSPFRKTNPSPLRKSILSPTKSPTRKSPAARSKLQATSKTKFKFSNGRESEPPVPSPPKQRRASSRAVEASAQEDEIQEPELQEESPPDEMENEGLATVEEEPEPEQEPEPEPEPEQEPEPAQEPEPEPEPEVPIQQSVDNSTSGVDESMVVLEEVADDPPSKVPKGKGKGKGKAKSRVQPDTHGADDSVMVLEEEPPAPPPPKKNRIQTIVREPVQRQKPAQTRKTSGSKRPAVEDDEERAEGSPPKRAKSTKGKSQSKAKAPAKKTGKTTKARPRGKKAGPSRAISVESEPGPDRTTPPPQDIMVPLQDSPPPRPKDSKRRRYTLMPVRTKEEMLHPDYDPIDCIGWR